MASKKKTAGKMRGVNGTSVVMIMDIYDPVSMVGGDRYLSCMMRDQGGILRNQLKIGEAVLFVNRSRTMVKIMAREGLYIWKCRTKQTFDLPDLVKEVGKYFKVSFRYRLTTNVIDMQPLPLKFRKNGTRPASQF
jgi:hypothetical protein